jgi:hypothetical protein
MNRCTLVLVCFLSLFAVFGASVPARADNIIQWTFSGAQFENGASLTGYFDIDYTAGGRIVTSWDITAGSGPNSYSGEIQLPLTNFTPSNSYVNNSGGWNWATTPYPWGATYLGLWLRTSGDLGPSGGTVGFTGGGTTGSTLYVDTIANLQYNTWVVSGSILGAPAPVPAPAPLLLLGPGLVGLAAVRRRLKK